MATNANSPYAEITQKRISAFKPRFESGSPPTEVVKVILKIIIDPAQDNDSNSLPKHFNSDLGTEAKNRDNWITVNHDIYGTRNSNQTTINAENVANLKIKWRLFSDAEISDPPIIISYTGYVQDSSGTVIAFDT